MLEFRSVNERSTWSEIGRRVEGVDENERIVKYGRMEGKRMEEVRVSLPSRF